MLASNVTLGIHIIHRAVDEDVHNIVDNDGETGRFLGPAGVVRGTG
jgi:hypothetical protein